jgi:hypothetical protein
MTNVNGAPTDVPVRFKTADVFAVKRSDVPVFS